MAASALSSASMTREMSFTVASTGKEGKGRMSVLMLRSSSGLICHEYVGGETPIYYQFGPDCYVGVRDTHIQLSHAGHVDVHQIKILNHRYLSCATSSRECVPS